MDIEMDCSLKIVSEWNIGCMEHIAKLLRELHFSLIEIISGAENFSILNTNLKLKNINTELFKFSLKYEVQVLSWCSGFGH